MGNSPGSINYDALNQGASASTAAAAPAPVAAPAAAPASAPSGDGVNYDALAQGATASTNTATPSQPGFWERTYESSGVKGLVDTAKQKWEDAQAGKNEEVQVQKEVVQHVKDGNYGQAAEILLGHIAKGALGPGGDLLINSAKSAYKNQNEGLTHVINAGVAATKGDASTAASEAGQAIYSAVKSVPVAGPLVQGTVDPAIQDVQNKNYSGLAGDAAGGAVKALPFVLSGGASGAAEAAEAADGTEAAEGADAAVAQSPKDATVAENTANSGISEGTPETVAPSGDDIQPSLQQGIRDVINKTADENGLKPAPDSVSVRDAAQNLADQFKARSQATFDKVEDITGINMTALKDQMAARADQITEAEAAGDADAAAKLQKLQDADEARSNTAFTKAKEQGVDVEQARDDWNKNLRANELSTKIRNADDGVRGNPSLNAGRLTKPLQKLADATGGRAGKLQQLMGDENTDALVQHAENAREATQTIKDFVPQSATGQQALSKIIADNTSETSGVGLRGSKTVAETDWNGVVKDIGNLKTEERAAFGNELQQVRQYASRQALKQTARHILLGKSTTGKILYGAAVEEAVRHSL